MYECKPSCKPPKPIAASLPVSKIKAIEPTGWDATPSEVYAYNMSNINPIPENSRPELTLFPIAKRSLHEDFDEEGDADEPSKSVEGSLALGRVILDTTRVEPINYESLTDLTH